ncbi:MAG TPA: HAD-IIA family hydrolase [Actinomycetota bacterium]|nr:HAD-IIA family hydrolase [Actinomycetota bacterium]
MAERPRLIDRYDAFLLDLDGVVYLADQPIPGAVDAVATLLASGRRVVFMTNNSAPTPEEVMDRLGGFGIPEGADLVTSGMVTARLLAAGDGHPRSAFVIGEGGVRVALADAGVDVLEGEPGAADFVVVGWDRSVDFDKLRRATILVRRGARLVATNADASYPAPGGELWPGTGALLAAVETATGARATVVGKPHRPLFDAAVERVGSRRPLVIGDRMDTDVAGAADAGLDAALVLSGAHGPADLLDHDAVPVAVAEDLAALLDRPAFPPIRSATAEDMEEVSALAAGDRGLRPDDTVVAADDRVEATATAVVRGPDALLRAVAVRQDRRGIGLGTLLVAAAVSDARRRGARRCWLLTETAEGFFIRLGFERADRASVPAWTASEGMADCREGAVAMHRELGQPSQPGR